MGTSQYIARGHCMGRKIISRGNTMEYRRGGKCQECERLGRERGGLTSGGGR